MISNAARKSASQFVLQNMLESEDSWNWVLLHKGAVIQDREGNEITSEFVERLAKQCGTPRNVRDTEKSARKQVREIEGLVHKYGKVQEEVSKQMLTKYPATVFPMSLLPAPKGEIQRALNEAIEAMKYTDYTENETKKMIENLKVGLAYLDRFIDDEGANKRNRELLENKEYQEAVKNGFIEMTNYSETTNK
jgi:hypothetical protein